MTSATNWKETLECPKCGERGLDKTPTLDENGAQTGHWWWCTECDWEYDEPEEETCVDCQSVISFTEAQENAEWLLEESNYTLDEGPHCGGCARRRRAHELEI